MSIFTAKGDSDGLFHDLKPFPRGVDTTGWVKPKENSIDALSYGIENSDGVEMDLRLSLDGEVIIHHDARTQDGSYPETTNYDDMKEHVDLFSDLLSKDDFVTKWVNEARFVCLELKAPHPSSGAGGGWLRGKEMYNHMSELFQSVRDMIKQIEVPSNSTVFYSFDPYITPVANRFSENYRHARLMPKLRQWGGWTTQRAAALPSFISTSVPRLLDKQRKLEAPMLPLALDYLHGWTRFLPIGATMGLQGKSLQKFNHIRRGHPVYVWPSPIEIEPRLLKAGLSCISDTMQKGLVYSDGSERCLRPGTMPFVENERQPWHEISDSERAKIVLTSKKKWGWSSGKDELLGLTSSGTMPWEMPRLIGHRGAGKDPETL